MSLFSIERMIAVFFPISTRLRLTRRKVFLQVAGLLAVAIVLYSYIVVTNEIILKNNRYQCGVVDALLPMTIAFIKLDTVVSVIIPFMIITIINWMIICQLRKSPVKFSTNQTPSSGMELMPRSDYKAQNYFSFIQ